MFALKKIISSFLAPFPLFLIFILISFVLWHRGYERRAKSMFIVSIVWISLFSYAPFASLLLKPLEGTYPKFDSLTVNAHYIHVLGSGHVSNPKLPLSSEIGLVSLDRVVEGVHIYKRYPNMKLIFSGYGGNDIISNARKNAQVAITLGVSPDDIVVLERPKDTYEEALAAKKLVGSEPLVLVTSASHMVRASALFRKCGLNIIEAPTDFQVKKADTLWQFPSAEGLSRSEAAFHEYLGLAWSKLQKTID